MSLLDDDTIVLDLKRWACAVTPADDSVLARATGPVLDIGCGPGRHVRALARRGVLALGLDAAPEAVHMARAEGAHVLEGSVFDHVPGAGRWQSALLLDGSVGIGGAPVRLLRRVRELLAPGGVVLVEGERPGAPTRVVQAHVELAGGRSAPFAWALVCTDDLAGLGRRAGLCRAHRWEVGGRWFAELA
jgi:SAM-dependent methyltransferase